MAPEDWVALCPEFYFGNGTPREEFIWDSTADDLTFCSQAIFHTAAHAVFLIVTAFYVGRLEWRRPSGAGSVMRNAEMRTVTVSWALRFFVSLAILILHFLAFILQLVWLEDHSVFGLISYAEFPVSLLAWLLHSSVTFNLTRRHSSLQVDGSDSLLLVLAWCPVFVTSTLTLRSVLLPRHSPNRVHTLITIVTFACQLLYITAGVLELYSSCIFIEDSRNRRISRTPSESSSIETGDPEETAEEDQRLINETPEPPSGVDPSVLIEEPKLGEPRFWGPLRFFLFLWVDPLMRRGANGRLRRADDLFEMPQKLRADQHAEALQRELARNAKSSKYYLPQVLIRLWGLRWLLLGVMKFAYSFLQYSSPLFVNVLVETIENPGKYPEYVGYLYGFGLIAVNLISNAVQLHYVFQVEKLAMCVRGALVDTVYGKLLRVHSSALSESMTSGQVVNLVGTDCQKVSENCQYLHQLWALPLQIAVALFLLYQQVGFAFIGGLVFTILLVPLNQLLASKISKQVEENLKQRDSRVKLMGEALSAIRVIKFHAWEKWFSERVGAVRTKEMRTVKVIKYLDAWCVYFWATTPLIMSVLTFTTFVMMGGQLTAAKVFTCLSVFGLVIVPLNAIPWIITGTVEAWISAKRLQTFLKLSEIDVKSYYAILDAPPARPGTNERNSSSAITIRQGNFTWTPQKDPALPGPHEVIANQLEDVELTIKRGELVGIIGRVGSGKSSLLNAIVAEMYQVDGLVGIGEHDLQDGFGFVPQDNWIQQGTVLSNTQFALPNSEMERYRGVIEACALEQDLQLLPAGDLTQIGEHGVTLSGGQKARIALARAVMQDKAIILMDDPLSAVDAQVANHIFEQCIVRLLRGKTRLFVTHHVDFLRSADRVIVMKDGRVVEHGPPERVLPRLPSLVEVDDLSRKDAAATDESETDEEIAVGENALLSRAPSEAVSSRSKFGRKRKNKTAQLVQDEQREYGTVKLSVYQQYWKAVGNFWAVSVFASLIAMQASYNVTDWWLSYWVTHEKDTFDPATNTTVTDAKYYLTVYGAIGAGNSVWAFIRSFVFAYAGLRAAYRMHDLLLSKVMRGRMLFFDSTPSGRILNRFAKDVTSVDNQLPFMLNILLACIFQLLGTLMVICYGLPWFVLLLIPIAPLYYFIQRFYRSTSREIKRINSLTQSPIYSLCTETVEGLATIRAMRADDFFHARCRRLLEDNLRAQFADMAANKWLNMRLQFLSMVIVSGVVMIALLVKSAAGTLGLTVSYSLTVVGVLNNFVTSLIETEKEMVSVERVMQYLADIQEEKYDGTLLQAPDEAWPLRGAVEFRGVGLRYREDLPAVLSDFTLTIRPAERIGVVGRTGAGKSSFLVTLFRLAEISHGSITIDGVDILHLPLQQLRSRLAIIPQTPSLFDASIRDNLDPLHKASDAELWSAIDMCDLRGAVDKLGGHLDVLVGENGRKLSLGQKQLVCLARALLTKARIICLDEATASVDYETDRLIQATLRRACSTSTVITIAHRLQTVMDYDRIVVMSEGRIVECDTPENLLALPTSHFAMLHQQSQRSGSATA
ncbi:Multidrug resistance-associated protein 7 [Hypsibius exemplaris]|uniref:ABC-type xenobiotic transporter n=1 Tax=Hypsibius exemplaris TaxID=2072580 RepID=A0A9X6NGL4_HYPEX|nr:Multidrug resistance-associated protein 7 [Hypsibius exemplaris]